MDNIGVGAWLPDGRPATKTALRKALADAPGTVRFNATAKVGPHIGKSFQGDAIPEGVRLNVVGPDPDTARVWYGNVTLGRNGRPRLD